MARLITLFDVKPLIEYLSKGDLILTPNQRLASRIRAAYAIHCRDQGQQVVHAPQVYSLNNWIEYHWEDLLIKASGCVCDCKLLSAAQEQVLWEQVVEGSSFGTALLRPAATAIQAISAYRTMVEWQHDLTDVNLREQFENDEDCSVFLAWVDEFETLCREKHWLPSARQPERLIKAFEQGELKKVQTIIGVGFDDLTPLHKTLIAKAGQFVPTELGETATNINVVSCENAKQELLSSAVWAKKVLNDNPQSTVALVIPNLAQQRQTVQRVLQEVFEPSFNLPDTSRRNMPFNFSAGSALIEAPIINAAINGLSICLLSLDLDMLIGFCQSPFYCLGPNDREAVCQLVLLLHNEKDYSISASRFRRLVLKAGESLITEKSQLADESENPVWHFASALQEQASYARTASLGKPRTPTQWLPIMQQLLDAIGWPGGRRLDSIEYQQVSQWQQVLEEFSSLDPVVKSINFNKAIVYLRGILSRHIFQPQTADSSLQVLGTLEAAGLQFSHIWLQSMSAQQWPAQPSPNALIPMHLQREHDMPHATAERELDYAKRLSQRFIHSAQTVVVSYPSMIDENPTRVSTLFSAYQQTTLTQVLGNELEFLIPLREIRRLNIESATPEPYYQGNAPGLSADEKVSGGSQLFASQSACPFKAFALHRLGLQKLPKPELGLGAADRGSLLHRALELVWEKLKSQKVLNQQSQEMLNKLCAEAADYALAEIIQHLGTRLGPRYCHLESIRLQNLLLAWLAVEKQRAPFVVESIELKKSFRFAELKLHTRIDRIDRLEDGSLLIIDYKTGSSSTNRWWGKRPDEPQLPLYSLLTDNTVTGKGSAIENGVCHGNVGAITFAQIHIDGCELKGVGSERLPEPLIQWQDKVKTDAGVENWPQLKQHWQQVLSSLAQDFIAGDSAVNPKQSPKTCQYCHLASVCRVNHQSIES